MMKAGKQIASPNGVYKEQFILSSNSTVYYNEETRYFLYRSDLGWVVNMILLRSISLILFWNRIISIC